MVRPPRKTAGSRRQSAPASSEPVQPRSRRAGSAIAPSAVTPPPGIAISDVLPGFTPNPIGPFPPLPDPIGPTPFPPLPIPPNPPLQPLPQPFPFPQPQPFFPLKSLRCGCYLISYAPVANLLTRYDGTMRVECHSNGRTASGDLYQRRTILVPTPGFPPRPPTILLGQAPNPSAGIPILSRARYRYYLRVTQLLEGFIFGTSFTLGFEMHRFDLAARIWTNEGAFTALMAWTPAPPGYPTSGDYLTGDVKNSASATVGRLTMGWVSKYLRKATIEIDRVNASEAPLDNGAGIDWKTVGDSIDWDISVDVSDTNVAEPSGESWSEAEAHAAMIARRDLSDLDSEWRYHVLAVRRIDVTERGVMYDNGATDSNNVPREGCVISSHWVIPNANPWGKVKGFRFGTAKAPYYRTAVHEIGHAMGLYHNTVDNGYMHTTPDIAASAPASNPFPNNIQWSYAPDDQKRLRHMPDVYVRPGGTPFGTSYATTPISPTDLRVAAEALRLEVTPLLASVPLGAPVRINLVLTNVSEAPAEAPASLSLGSGFVKGRVTDPSGTMRTFSPLVLCMDEQPMTILQPGESVRNSLTLLRGGQGALFPGPGFYTIQVEATWDMQGLEAIVAGQASTMVTSAADADHASAALHVLSTPDALLSVVIGGDHLAEGNAAIQATLDNPILRPHFAYLEAKRRGRRFGQRNADLQAAADLIDEDTILSPAETKKVVQMAKDAAGAPSAKITKTLRAKVAKGDASDEIQSLVREL